MSRNKNIDVGLGVLCAIAKRGQTMTYQDMADVCQCSKQRLQQIEASAIKKIERIRVMRDYYNEND